jgi:hypothetical protein
MTDVDSIIPLRERCVLPPAREAKRKDSPRT